VIAFMEETWFLWWIVAVIVILRWFHVSLSGSEAVDVTVSAEPEGTSIASGRLSSGGRNRLFV